MSKNHDPTRARRHWVYSRADLCDVFSVGDSTITNWINNGLQPIDARRPQLFAGSSLRRFITSTRWPHGRAPENGRLYCSDCLGFKPLKRAGIQSLPQGIGSLRVTGLCTDCDSMLEATIPVADYAEILNASANIPRDSSDVMEGGMCCGIGRNGSSIRPETNRSNLRWLYAYRIFLEDHQNLDVRTVDEHLRAISRMSGFFGNKPFEGVKIADIRRFKDRLRICRDEGQDDRFSASTVSHLLGRCGAFFTWLSRQPGIRLEPDLPGYFGLSRKERTAEAAMAKETALTFDLALTLYKAMPQTTPLELRNRAIIAFFIVTGIRIAALITLRGRHVNMDTRWINQDPKEVDTKLSKKIRTYCLDLGHGLLEAIREWAHWRTAQGFGDDAPFFLPDRFIQTNALGLAYQTSGKEPPQCWKSEDPVQRIIKEAAKAADVLEGEVSSHDFRKVIHPFLAKCGGMTVSEEVALQLNLGHTPLEVIRRHYARMTDAEREAILDDLCRRACSSRSELDLYLSIERGTISEADADYSRAKAIYLRYNDGVSP